MSRSETIPEDTGVAINDPVAFYIVARCPGRPRRKRLAGTVVWVDRTRGTVEVIDREGREHTLRVTEVRRQQW